MAKRAILYTRVSTDEQALHGYSLRDQQEKLKMYCSIHGIEPVAHFQDDHSAKSFDRPEFKKLLEFIRQNKNYVDLILFIKWDRFSRNAPESYDMLATFKKLKVEAQAIEQPLDMDIPENKLMLALYLATPEVENDRRSLNTKHGMRRANKEGRWCNQAPKGYSNKRDENNRPIIVPNNDAEFIKSAFEEIQKGENTIEYVRKKLGKEGFLCSKSRFSEILRNPVYMGKIKLSAIKGEEECLISGIHKPLISECAFYDVQDVLNGRKINHSKRVRHGENTELPLRGFLECPRCGSALTGSGSRGNGGKYYYYHCSHGCKERVKATVVHDEFIELLKSFEPRDEMKDLYDEIVSDLWKERETGRKGKTDSISEEIKKIQSRIENLQDKLADDLIEPSDYNATKQRYDAQLRALNQKKQEVTFEGKDLREQLEFGYRFLKQLPNIFPKCPLDVQRRIVGSIFPEKISFYKNKVRTNRVNEVAALIRSINEPFSKNKKGQFCRKTKLSFLVAPNSKDLNLFLRDLIAIGRLKDLM